MKYLPTFFGVVLTAVWFALAVSASCCAETNAEAQRVPSAGLTQPPVSFVGRHLCATCHQDQQALWAGSHHDLAMQQASDATVLGDFNWAGIVGWGAKRPVSTPNRKPIARATRPNVQCAGTALRSLSFAHKMAP